MQTSWNDQIQIEAYLKGELSNLQQVKLQTRMACESDFYEQVELQKKSLRIINIYGRQELKAELEQVHLKLFTVSKYSRFRQRVLRLFS